jgi:hypothetical protein
MPAPGSPATPASATARQTTIGAQDNGVPGAVPPPPLGPREVQEATEFAHEIVRWQGLKEEGHV